METVIDEVDCLECGGTGNDKVEPDLVCFYCRGKGKIKVVVCEVCDGADAFCDNCNGEGCYEKS